MPEVMVALDLNQYWGQAPFELIDRLKRAGCTHYKVHDPLPGMDLKATVSHLRKAVLPGKTADAMYDNKELDIPSRVEQAVENHLRMGFNRTTVHVRSGPKILKALEKAGLSKNVVVVLTLTSDDDEDTQTMYGATHIEILQRWAKVACDCGDWGGIVCGGPDISSLPQRARTMPLMTPGIYLPGQSKPADQRIAATPKEASDFGATHLIVGRGVIQSKYPEQIFADITAQVAAA